MDIGTSDAITALARVRELMEAFDQATKALELSLSKERAMDELTGKLQQLIVEVDKKRKESQDLDKKNKSSLNRLAELDAIIKDRLDEQAVVTFELEQRKAKAEAEYSGFKDSLVEKQNAMISAFENRNNELVKLTEQKEAVLQRVYDQLNSIKNKL